MVKYEPNNELSQEEMDILAEKDFDMFLDYLDQKADYLKQFSKPLSEYHMTRYSAISKAEQGKDFTMDDLKSAKKKAKEDAAKHLNKEQEKEWTEKRHEMLKRVGVKNVKTRRDQWFD
jgi:ABC-type dipeptide/oligopeptide/nickel transport system ATPase component